MDLFWKTISIALMASILVLSLEKQGKDFSLLITLAATGSITIAALHFLEPVMDFLSKLTDVGEMNSSALLVLMKILGVGLTGEVASAICTDAGNASLSKGIRFLASSVIFSLSIPIFSSLIDLIENLLGCI